VRAVVTLLAAALPGVVVVGGVVLPRAAVPGQGLAFLGLSRDRGLLVALGLLRRCGDSGPGEHAEDGDEHRHDPDAPRRPKDDPPSVLHDCPPFAGDARFRRSALRQANDRIGRSLRRLWWPFGRRARLPPTGPQ